MHADCRSKYVNLKRVKQAPAPTTHSSPKKHKLRSSQPPFEWKVNCFYCYHEVRFDDRHPARYPPSRRVQGRAESVEMINAVRRRCDERNDSFASTRLGNITDLVAEEAVYHSSCSVKFFSEQASSSKSQGRPENSQMQIGFDKLCTWLENESQLLTLEDLHGKMLEFSNGADVYGVKRIKQKLMDKYRERVFFAEISSRNNVVCFRNMANWVVNDKWHAARKADIKDESKQLLKLLRTI